MGEAYEHEVVTYTDKITSRCTEYECRQDTPVAQFTDVDEHLDEHLAHAHLLLRLSENKAIGGICMAEATKGNPGGAHEKRDLWTAEEMGRLLMLVALYKNKDGKTEWKNLMKEHFKNRTLRSARSCYCRFKNALSKRYAKGGQYRCRMCGEFKLGHVCQARCIDNPM